MVLDELAGVVVVQEGIFDKVEVVVLYRACRGREGKKVIDRCGDFERAFVTVPFDPVDPFRIDHARADHPRDFFVQCSDNGAFRARMVIVIDRAILALKRVNGRGGAALELIIIVAVQDVVFAVVLILDDGIRLFQPRFEPVAIWRAFGVG